MLTGPPPKFHGTWEILWESDTATDAEVGAIERLFIRLTGANNPAIGYNLTPRRRHADR